MKQPHLGALGLILALSLATVLGILPAHAASHAVADGERWAAEKEPTDPDPADNAVDVSLEPVLRWEAPVSGDVDSYSIELREKDGTFREIASGLEARLYNLDSQNLSYETEYYWVVTVHFAEGETVKGSAWRFTTQAEPQPGRPSNPEPVDAAEGVSVYPTLRWSAPETGEVTDYSVKLGKNSQTFTEVASGLTEAFYSTEKLGYDSAYYWQVVANFADGKTLNGPIWHFTTQAELQPGQPSNPDPAEGNANVSVYQTLRWSPPETGDVASYSVKLGESSQTFTVVATGLTDPLYSPGTENLSYNRDYYWQVVVLFAGGETEKGPIWHFAVQAEPQPGERAPTQPASPAPADAESEVDCGDLTLQWAPSTSPDGNDVRYTVKLGTNSRSLSTVASNLSTPLYTPTDLDDNTTYYWHVIAYSVDENGAATGGRTEGPYWKFTTEKVLSGGCNALPGGAGAAWLLVVPVLLLAFWKKEHRGNAMHGGS